MKFVLIFLYLFTKANCAVDLAPGARNFSVELVYFTQQETNGHTVISPLGVWSLLTSLTIAAAGNSRSELVRALSLPPKQALINEGYKSLMQNVLDPKTDGLTLTSKNFLFLDNSFRINDKFQQSITSDFEAKVARFNFKDANAANKANRVIENSGANVRNVLQSDDFRTSRMVLTNVISFKGFWNSPFNASETKVEPFFDEDGNEIGKVNMMKQRNPLPYSNIKEMSARVLEMPYGNDNKYSMLIILPHTKERVIDVYKRLDNITITYIFERLKSDEEMFDLDDVDVKLPRFKISTNVVLNKPLNDMGVFDIFDSTYADFKPVSNEELYVSSVVHKADIEVTETGTTASASSSAKFANRISPGFFHVQKPFIYLIMEKPTATVIFGGIYSKPSIF